MSNISFIRGHLGGMDDDGRLTIVDGAGVGHAVTVSDRDRDRINVKGEGGDGRVEVHCRTKANENDVTVYGFLSLDDRRAFDRLLKVDGIGPTTALRLLSKLSADDLKAAITARDLNALYRVPMIGRKTAAKLCDEVQL